MPQSSQQSGMSRRRRRTYREQRYPAASLLEGVEVATLHIEHGITSFTQWKSAFDRFADLRGQAGVLRHRIYRPVDDAHYVMIDLDFNTPEEAQAFLDVLRTRVWPSPQNAPALVGTPLTRILDAVESSTV